MKKIVSAFVMLIGATMLFSGLASAEINFTAYDDSELLNADFDITSGGVYTTMDKVVFWIQVKGQINLNPEEGCALDYTIDMYLKNNQEIKVEDLAVENRIKKMENLWRTSIFEDPRMVYGVFYARAVGEIDETMERIVCMKGVKQVHYEIIVRERFFPRYLDYVAAKMESSQK